MAKQDGDGGGGTTTPTVDVNYFDNDFDWPPAGAEARLAAIPVLDVEGGHNQEAAAANWEAFYQRHARRADVYKVRRYLPLAFEELKLTNGVGPRTLLEVGCGLGSSLAAILEANATVRCLACDVSPTALQLLRAKLPAQHLDRVQTFRCDVAAEPGALQAAVGGPVVDLAMLVFTLSAIAPGRHVAVLRNLRGVMRPGSGLLLFRDYGQYDMTQLRGRERRGERLFVRQDGTLACFLSPDALASLLEESGGWEIVECRYACVRNINRSTGQVMERVFLHAKARAVE